MNSRERLVRTAAALLRRDGYYGLGIADVLRDSGATSGSLYHHFPGGKEELAVAAIGEAERRWSVLIDRAFAITSDASEAFDRFFSVTADELERTDFGFTCEVGLPCSEAATPAVVEAGDVAFAAWIERIRWHLDAAGIDDAERLAEHALVVFQGALLMARVRRDGSILRRSAEQIVQHLNSDGKGPEER